MFNEKYKPKEHPDAIEFLGNLLKHHDEETIETTEVFQLECINIQCSSFNIFKIIITSILPVQNHSL